MSVLSPYATSFSQHHARSPPQLQRVFLSTTSGCAAPGAVASDSPWTHVQRRARLGGPGVLAEVAGMAQFVRAHGELVVALTDEHGLAVGHPDAAPGERVLPGDARPPVRRPIADPVWLTCLPRRAPWQPFSGHHPGNCFLVNRPGRTGISRAAAKGARLKSLSRWLCLWRRRLYYADFPLSREVRGNGASNHCLSA